MKKTSAIFISVTLAFICLWSSDLYSKNLRLEIELVEVEAQPYHKPYVAVWLENDKRQAVHTLLFWREQAEWFKDLRKWWRKIGRDNSHSYEAVSGATRKMGKYVINWNGILKDGKQLAEGEYTLHFEAVREQGNREYLRKKIHWGSSEREYQLNGKLELGLLKVIVEKVNENDN